MGKNLSETSIHWYALKVFFNRVFWVEDYLKKRQINSYIPCETTFVVLKNGVKKKIRKPVISSLLFFQSTEHQALEVQELLNNRVMLYVKQNSLSKKPIAIPEKEMNMFMLVSSSGEKGLEYFGDFSVPYHKGEHVRVIDGPLKGAEGYIRRIKGNHRLIVAIQGVCAVATSYIPQCILQKI